MSRENNKSHVFLRNMHTSANRGKEEELKEYRFAVIPKNINNIFFHEVRDGCVEEALIQSQETHANVTCIFVGPNTTDEGELTTKLQIQILDDIIHKKTAYHGVSIAVNNAQELTPKINEAVTAGIPVITFDSDAPDSTRIRTVGTNNTAFGEMLGKMLLQLEPKGGNYSIISTKPALNLEKRVEGIKKKLNDWDSNWILNDVFDGKGSIKGSLDAMKQSMKEYPNQKVIIPVGSWPMVDVERWNEFVGNHMDLLTVVGDATDPQIKALKHLKVDALVGQMPFLMGKLSICEFQPVFILFVL